MGMEIPWYSASQHDEFEYQSPSERLTLLLAVAWLLDDWPERFLSLSIQAHFTRSRLAEHLEQLPFWLARVADEYLDHRHYLPNAMEIRSAGYYLQSHGEEVTPRTLVKCLGLTKDCMEMVWKQWSKYNQAIR